MDELLAYREAEQPINVSMFLLEGTSVTITREDCDIITNKIAEALKELFGDQIESLYVSDGWWDLNLDDDTEYELKFDAKMVIKGEFYPKAHTFIPTDDFLYCANSEMKEFKEMLKDLPIAKYIDFSTVDIFINEDKIVYGDYVDFM